MNTRETGKKWNVMDLFALLCVLFPRMHFAFETQYVKRTDSALLKCHELQEPYLFAWHRKDGGFIYANEKGINPNLTLPLKNKLKLRSRFFLEISNASENDSGIYSCNSMGKETEIHLKTAEPLSNIRVLQANGTNNVCGIEGHILTLTCMVTSGKPDNETIAWIQNGSILNVGGPQMLSLTFVPKVSDNLNTYTCEANNGVYQTLTYSVKLMLTLIPRISMLASPREIVIEGQTLEIICVLESLYTSATISWIHNHKPVSEESVMRKTDMNNGRLESILFSKVNRVDAGYYKCIAKNSAGINEAQTKIVVKSAPNVVIKNVLRTSETTSCICEASGFSSKYTFEPWEHLTESRQHIRYVTGFSNRSTSTLQLRNSFEGERYQDSGIYVCRVSHAVLDGNRQLLQRDSITLPYTGKPVFVSTTGMIQHGHIGENVSLEAYVFSDPNQSSLHSYWNVSKKVVNCSRCQQNCNQLKLKTSFYNALVEVTGYRCALDIQNIQESDFQLYTITVSNIFGNSSLTVKLTPFNKESFEAVNIAIIFISIIAVTVVVILLTCWQRINVRTQRENSLNYTVNEEGVSGVAENSLYQLGTLPRSSDEYSSIDRRSPIDGRFNSEVLVHREEQFIQPGAVSYSSENIIVLHEDQESTRLHYAEVSFEDVETKPRHNEPCIRELVSSNEYAEVEHTVKPNPLPESGSDVSSEDDFVYVRNIQLWRQELFK